MFCPKCGIKLDSNLNFCTNCGNQLNQPQNNQNINYNNFYSQNSNQINKSKKTFDKKKIVIISLLLVIILMMSAVAILFNKKSTNQGTRTIMIYMAGSNLESDAAIATSELDSIKPSEVDLDNINILVYTGGTLKWHNYVNPNENAIYQLTDNGFKKIQTYEKISLGESSTFTNFLNYAYKNFKTDNYDLVIWDHGLGALGAVNDDNFNDFLNVKEMKESLKASPFDENNKLSTITFRTCLNGTIEIASIFEDYANYLVASEEITLGKTGYSVLNYINNISTKDDGLSYSKKFVESYQNQIELIDPFETADSTYAIIDLTKFDKLAKEFNEFISDIDFTKNYDEIARIRSNLHQYAVNEANSYDYDTVDLYNLITNLKYISPENAQDVLNILDEMILYNWATNESSNGLAIYFPYNGSNEVKQMHLQIYDYLEYSSEYKTFINKFYNAQNSAKSFNYDLTKNETKLEGDEFSLKLTDEQVSNFAKAGYIIFKKNKDGNYQPILSTMGATLTEDGYVKTNISNNLIKISDNIDPTKYEYAMISKKTNEKGEDEYTTIIILWDLKKFEDYLDGNKEGNENYSLIAQVTFKINEKKEPYIASTLVLEDGVTGPAVNFDDYDSAEFSSSGYKILDKNGKYTEDWESHSVYYAFGVNPKEKDYVLSLDSLHKDDGEEYYCVFKIFDINNNYYYSDLMKIN